MRGTGRPAPPSRRPVGRHPQALRHRAQDLADWLDGPGADVPLDDVLGTLWHGRRHLAHRAAIALPHDAARMRAALRQGLHEAARAADVPPAAPDPAVAVLLPGQGIRLTAADLPADDPAFAADLARLQAAVLDAGGPDLRSFADWGSGDPRLLDTAVVQPLLFTASLAHLWWLERQGIRPDTLLGHSIGELTAAAYAGVLDVEDAAAAVVRRGALMGETPAGAMLAVPLDETAARALVDGLPADVCGVNGPDDVVLGGDLATVAELERRCSERGLATTRLATSHAFHTRAMEQAAARFGEFLGTLRLSAPRTTVISNLTGAALTAEQATSPDYWAAQLRGTVRLDEGVRTLLAGRCDVVIGVGGSRSLTNPVRRTARALDMSRPPRIVELLGGSGQDTTLARDAALAQLWAAGCPLGFAPPLPERPAPLPRYPFAATRHWLDAPATALHDDVDTAPPGRQETAALAASKEMAAAEPEAESSDIATAITEIWQDTFGGAPLTPEDNFFTLGGTSLQAAQLIAVINDTLLLALVLGDLYEHSDLAAFIHRAEQLAAERDDDELLRLLDEIEEAS
ncbi:acyltransferase domain-containing protein [Streptomyces sp. CA-132043]|uniref:acyltransferase domain-containing protein n=1 Tax=Streptomyces sp. CA-132043 TaxID=3240048 RepID=UPI003D91CB04